MLHWPRKSGGIARLVDEYRSEEFGAGKGEKKTVQIGSVRYRKCAFLMPGEAGLGLKIKFVFQDYPAVLVPWASFQGARETTLYGRKAVRLAFEDPTMPSISIYEDDARALQAWMPLDPAGD